MLFRVIVSLHGTDDADRLADVLQHQRGVDAGSRRRHGEKGRRAGERRWLQSVGSGGCDGRSVKVREKSVNWMEWACGDGGNE